MPALDIVFLFTCLFAVILASWKLKWEWGQWFVVFIIASIADIVSTFVGIYVYFGGDWSYEINPWIQGWGQSFGFVWAIFAVSFVIFLLFYLIGCVIEITTQLLSRLLPILRRPLMLFMFLWSFGLCFFAFIRFHAAIHNFLFPFVTLPLPFS